MIPILYSRNIEYPAQLVADKTNGLGRLNDSRRAIVTEERNGQYELEIEYPVYGAHFDEISYNSWIKAKPSPNGSVQCFRVYKVSKPMNGVCTIYAEHISYAMSFVMINPISNVPFSGFCSAVFPYITNHLNPFRGFDFVLHTSYPDLMGTFVFDKAIILREFLMGDEDSILSTYPDGEFGFDNLDVWYYGERGSRRNVKIKYGRNLLALQQDISDEPLINGVYPYWTGGVGGQWLWLDRAAFGGSQPHDAVIYNNAAVQLFGFYPRIVPLQMHDDERWPDESPPEYDEAYGIDDFKTVADEFFASHSENLAPEINIDVSFVDLRATEEYKRYYPLETIELCDIVTVEHPLLDISADFKVVKTVFDVINERYDTLTLGSLRKTLS